MLPSPLLGTQRELILSGVPASLPLQQTTLDFLAALSMTVVAERWQEEEGLMVLAESHASVRRCGDTLRIELFSCTPLPADLLDQVLAHYRPHTLTGQRCLRGPCGGEAPISGTRWLFSLPDPDAALPQALGALGWGSGVDLFHRFQPHGLTWIRTDGSRRIIAHTWPEHGLLTLDLYGSSLAAIPAGWRPCAEAAALPIPLHSEA